jgi:hypothetical protein
LRKAARIKITTSEAIAPATNETKNKCQFITLTPMKDALKVARGFPGTRALDTLAFVLTYFPRNFCALTTFKALSS